jgi:hypothetical protein
MPKLIFHSLVALLLVVSCECKDMHIRRMPDEKDIVFEGEAKTAKKTVSTYRKGQSRARLDETHRREERRRQEAPRREQEERRARLDEAYRRDEERRRQEAAREAEVMSAAAQQAPAACAQEDDNVEEVYTDYRAMPSNANPPSTDPSPNDRPDI